MPKIELDALEQTNSTGYPPPYNADVAGRWYRRIGKAGGLTEIGISHVVLEPGAWSSQRHWHEGLDEFVVMLDGEAVLVEDDGETVLRAGDCAVFPKDVANGHHLVNRSKRPCTLLAIDNRRGEGDCHYPDADLRFDAANGRYTHKDGST
ncbi:MAG TPA: cupin domain-containing protein, partial [Sphingomicrobium sp.]|nr:cupin domain-containing protein [Sphingomicrobium sp.]